MEYSRTIKIIVLIVVLIGVTGFVYTYFILGSNRVSSVPMQGTLDLDLSGYTNQELYNSYVGQQQTIKDLQTDKAGLEIRINDLENQVEGLKIIINKSHWLSYVNDEIDLSFKYPEQFGKIEKDGSLDEYGFSLQF